MYRPIQTSLIAGVAGSAVMLMQPCSAVSQEAGSIQESKYGITQSIEQSIALFGGKEEVLSMICELEAECCVENWDGYGALPLSNLSVETAKEFIRLLPDSLAMPEIAPEPDGSVSLDWMPSRYRTFSLSIGESDQLAYAWVDGTDRGHAVARFNSQIIPERVLQGITSFA
jgi:hypothetical protein